MKTNKGKKIAKKEAEEWDLAEGMGILPEGIPFTQNIGCVGGKPKKSNNSGKSSSE